MINLHLDAGTENDINKRIDKVLLDLGKPQNGINLFEVRDLLKLDLKYYSTSETGFLDQVIHKLKIGAKQVVLRPAILIEVVKKFDLKALFQPDVKRILIDQKLPDLKKRWAETHEISHSLLPWHSEYLLGDDRSTLSPACHEKIEAEANYGAGRLLFSSNAFIETTATNDLTISQLKNVAKQLGNTITSTIWRYAENSSGNVFACIGDHPHYCETNKAGIEYLIRSKTFSQQFAQIDEGFLFNILKKHCSYKKQGPIGKGEIQLMDINGLQHNFIFETFSNTHQALTVAHYIGPVNLMLAVA